jgi:hypothetical protein
VFVVVVEVGGIVGCGTVVVSTDVVVVGGGPPHPASNAIVPIIAVPVSSRRPDVLCFMCMS